MSRPIEKQLSKLLVDSEFSFMERGIRELNEIYDIVKKLYGNLCDDDYKCIHNELNYGQPEWKHVVRFALERVKSKTDSVTHSGNRGYWNFL